MEVAAEAGAVVGSDGGARRTAVTAERRHDVRVMVRGSAIVYGAVMGRGRVTNLSGGGIHIELGDGEARCDLGAEVAIELHLDRAGATWLRFEGDVVRVERQAVAIAFRAVPVAFAEVLQEALRSAVVGAAKAHVLVVDADEERRAACAALLRSAECTVAEAATPLDAIAHLAGSSIESWVVAIADSDPRETADELRRYLSESDAKIEIVCLGSPSPTLRERLFAGVDARTRT